MLRHLLRHKCTDADEISPEELRVGVVCASNTDAKLLRRKEKEVKKQVDLGESDPLLADGTPRIASAANKKKSRAASAQATSSVSKSSGGGVGGNGGM